MFCWHKYGQVKNKYQYCIKCGIARSVTPPPLPALLSKPEEPPCRHQWERYSEITSTIHKGVVGHILECSKCGDMKNHHISD